MSVDEFDAALKKLERDSVLDTIFVSERLGFVPCGTAAQAAHDAWKRRPVDERAWVAIDNALVDVGVGALSRWQRLHLALRRVWQQVHA